jgi:uncharacterized membrane protein
MKGTRSSERVMEPLGGATRGVQLRRVGEIARSLAYREPILLGLIAVGAVLRFGTLARQSFWLDEAFTAWDVNGGFLEVFRRVAAHETTPPLYFVLAWGWGKVFGTGEFELRALSALLGTATIAVAYLAARQFVARRTALVVAGLVATSPFLVWYSQEARSYSLFALLGAASLYFLGVALSTGSRKAIRWWAVISVLAVATHYFAVFLAVAEAAVLLSVPRLRRATFAPVALFAAGGAGLLLLAVHQKNEFPAIFATTPLWRRVVATGELFLTGSPYSSIPHAGWVLVLAGTCVAVGFVLLVRGRDRRGGLLMAALALAVFAGAILVSRNYYHDRNLIEAWIPLAIVVAAILAAPRLGRLGIILPAAVCVALAAITLSVAATPSWQRDDWRGMMAAIGPRSDRVLVIDPWSVNGPTEYYRATAPLPAHGRRTRELVEIRFRPGAVDFRAPAGFKLVEQRRMRYIRLRRFRAARPTVVTAATLGTLLPEARARVDEPPKP